MTRNITLALEEEILEKAKLLAARRGLSVSGLLRRELLRLVEDEDAFRRARESALRRLAKGSALGGGPYPSREELHERA